MNFTKKIFYKHKIELKFHNSLFIGSKGQGNYNVYYISYTNWSINFQTQKEKVNKKFHSVANVAPITIVDMLVCKIFVIRLVITSAFSKNKIETINTNTERGNKNIGCKKQEPNFY